MIYGQRWSKKFERDTLVRKEIHDFNVNLIEQEWHNAIKRFSSKAIGTAIEYSRDSCSWPPSISEFVEFCNQAQHQINLNCHNKLNLLTKDSKSVKRSDKDILTAEKYLEIIRGKLSNR